MFEIGDRILAIEATDGRMAIVGKLGTVRAVYDFYASVEFDVYVKGHTIDGRCENGYGWNVLFKDMYKVGEINAV